jgi:hypothetical protein
MPHTLIIPAETRSRLTGYLASLRAGSATAGGRLHERLAGTRLADLTEPEFLNALLNTKIPQIFAESAVAGDGSDWNLTELGLLGDISIAVPVTVFDNGHHTAPVPHAVPFTGTLVFTPGALLRNGRGQTPADWAEVTQADGKLDTDGYHRLYERRLLPVFQQVNASAARDGKKALLTLPGLGCGQFAGPFAGTLGAELQAVLEQFLTRHGESFPHIRAVYYDPFSECSNSRREISGISLMIRPLLMGNAGKSQLCPPPAYAEEGDDFSDCSLTSIVAWDHVSWPGNDYFGGNRCTDDGVKAAATSSMAVLTGFHGHYDPQRAAYLPPPPYRTWNEVVTRNALALV